jgi:hypothetical protein
VTIGILGAACSDASKSTSATPTIPGSGAAQPVVQVPGYVDSTGHVDVTNKLQGFLAKVPNGRVIRFRPGGRYRLDGTLFIGRRRDLTFDGAGATVFAVTRGGQNRSQFRVRDGSGIRFRNLKIKGAHPDGGTGDDAYIPKLAKQIGIKFEGVDGAEVDHVTITDVYGDFVYVGLDEHEVASQNVWIHDSTFRSNGRQGIAVTAATGVIIERNRIDNTRRSTIDLEPTGHRWRVDHVFVLNNVVGKGRLLFVAAGGQGPVSNIVVAGNRLHGHGLTIDVKQSGKRRRSNWVVANNTSDLTMTNRSLRFTGIDGLLLRGNHQIVTGKNPGVLLAGVCGAVVENNQFGPAEQRRSGDPCPAHLTIPQPPAIPGRTAAALPIGASSGGGTSTWVWIVVAIAALSILGALGALGALVRRRRRRDRRAGGPDDGAGPDAGPDPPRDADAGVSA